MRTLAGKVKQLFSVDGLLGKQPRVGELPAASEMYGQFIRIAWPSVVEAVLIGLVGIVDTMMVGTLGDSAIAAVSICNQPKFIILCFVMALYTAITAVVARRKGEGKREEANQVLHNAFLLGTVMIIVLAALGYIFAKPYLKLAGAGDDYIDQSVAYFKIILFSVVLQALTGMINAAQKACGNTRISMTTSLTSNLINVLFNYLLINGVGPFPRLEVRGAAIATVIGCFGGFLMSLRCLLLKKNYITLFYKAPWKMEEKILRPLFKVYSSGLAEQFCMRVGFFIFARIVAKLGTELQATHNICINILSMSYFFGDGFQVAATSLVGQNLGAKRPDKAYIYCSIGQRCGFLSSALLSVVFITLRRQLVQLFSKTPEVIRVGSILMLFCALITFLQTSNVVFTGCLRGAGDTRYTAKSSLFCIGFIRTAASYLLAYPLGLGIYGAWLGLLLDQGARLLFSSTRVRKGKWMRIQL